MGRNFVDYHKSIASELDVLKDRIRHLIGSAHWLTDGEHKEAILRKIISNYLPEAFHVGRGFVCYPGGESSTQLDILITTKSKPTLFKDGELVFVTPDAVRAIVEVKTKQTSSDLKDTVKKLAEELQKVRDCHRSADSCWWGVFVYEPGSGLNYSNTRNGNALSTGHKNLLLAMHEASARDSTFEAHRVINCASVGKSSFARFWRTGHQAGNTRITTDTWHSYELQDDLKGLAQAYFLSNLVEHLSNGIMFDGFDSQYAWFPIHGGKEKHRKGFIRADDNEPQAFA